MNEELKELKIVVENETELRRLRDKLDKVKLVVFTEFNKHPLTNVLELPYIERNIIKERIKELFYSIDEDELTKKFNKICVETLFYENAKIDNYPIYNRYNEPIEEVLSDLTGNLIK